MFEPVSSYQASFGGRLGLQQRVLPVYRAPFCEALAAACSGGLSVFAGRPLPVEAIETTDRLSVAHLTLGSNRQLFDPSSPFYLCWQAGLLDWLESWQPDALIVEANPRYRSTPAAIGWMHARRRPVIGWGLGAPQPRGLLASWRQRSWPRFLRQFDPQTDALIAYSQRGAEQYRALGFPTERVFVAPNAVALRPAAPPPPRMPAFDGRPVVLFIGRLQARKRLDHLLLACAALPASRQPRLIIVGDGPERASLQALADQVYPAAEFPGARHGPDLEPFFAVADLFVLPGTGGLAIQQAMAHGLPVIVAQGDGTQDDLVRPENGWLISPGDPAALITALHSALADAVRLRQMGLEAYRMVTEDINLERMVATFVQASVLVTDRKESSP
jgi:glycosyltransferase involved in cell wall biosynthesis